MVAVSSWQKTHSCGELSARNVGLNVVLNGWVHNWRNHGGIIFVDLRDRYGITQVVFNPMDDPETSAARPAERKGNALCPRERCRL